MGITDRDGITKPLKGIDSVTGENLPMGSYSEYAEESLYAHLSQLEKTLDRLLELSEQEQRILRKAKTSIKYIRNASTDKSYAYALLQQNARIHPVFWSRHPPWQGHR